MSGLSTHVLDTASGRPVSGLRVRLYLHDREISSGTTNQDGRIPSVLPEGFVLKAGTYRLEFETGAYFPDGFYPVVAVSFSVRDEGAHFHVPLLISPFGYSTYRGS